MGLFDAIKQMAETSSTVPPAGDPDSLEPHRHAQYHKRIVFVGGCFAGLGVALGLLISLLTLLDGEGVDIRAVVLGPIMFGAAGFAFGMSVACLVAPRDFLTGPVGAPWMKMIGTQSVRTARIACLLFGLVVTLPLVGIGLLIAFR